MATSKAIVCPSCGFANTAPLPHRRCVSCGARVDEARRSRSQRGDGDPRLKRGGFSPTWFGVSVVICATLTLAIVMGVPMLVPLFDFEGYGGMLVAIPVWFAAGALIGLVSPGRTYVEPSIATLLVAIPTAALLFQYQAVKAMPAFLYAMLSALGVVFAVIGVHLGERIQMGPPPKRAE